MILVDNYSTYIFIYGLPVLQSFRESFNVWPNAYNEDKVTYNQKHTLEWLCHVCSNEILNNFNFVTVKFKNFY